MSRSLYAHNLPEYDEAQALRWQAIQVSAISLTNFGGRILIGKYGAQKHFESFSCPLLKRFSLNQGFFSDLAKNLYKTPRSHALALVALLYLISQVVAAYVSNISNLWIASALLGLAHGSISAMLPTVTLEWFGLRELFCIFFFSTG